MTVLLDDPMVTTPWVIDQMRRETADTFTFILKPVKGHGRGSFQFEPGQFNMLYVFGTGEVPISISGTQEQNGKLEHTTRVAGTVTGAMGKLRSGDVIGIRGPFGSHWPIENAIGKDVIVVAGGIGLAPLRPVYNALVGRRDEFNKIVLLYGSRTPEDILFRSELEKLSANLDIEVFVTVDRSTMGWRGNVGVVTSLLRNVPFDPRNAVAMVCGPEIMMRFSVHELQRRGLKEEEIYISMERNMKCAIGHCGHCQYGPEFICKDGPVFPYNRISNLLGTREL